MIGRKDINSNFINGKRKEKDSIYNLYFQKHPKPTFLFKLNGFIEEANEAFFETLGYSEDEVIGTRIQKAPFLTDESRKKISENLKKRLAGGEVKSYSLRMRTTEGEVRTREIDTKLIVEGERLLGVLAAVEEEKPRKDQDEMEKTLHSLLRHDVLNKAQTLNIYHDLLGELDLPDRGPEYLDKAEEAVRSIIDLVEKVRSAGEVGEEELGVVDVDEVLERVVASYEGVAREEGFNVRRDECGCKVLAGGLLEEVFSNLVENALTHSGGEELWIVCREEFDECVVRVEDDGRGISDGEKREVFDRGYRGGGEGGTGLGLYLAKELVESYGGSIEVKDSELGGARFDVHLEKVEGSDYVEMSGRRDEHED